VVIEFVLLIAVIPYVISSQGSDPSVGDADSFDANTRSSPEFDMGQQKI
jgi:hypothetical protein